MEVAPGWCTDRDAQTGKIGPGESEEHAGGRQPAGLKIGSLRAIILLAGTLTWLSGRPALAEAQAECARLSTATVSLPVVADVMLVAGSGRLFTIYHHLYKDLCTRGRVDLIAMVERGCFTIKANKVLLRSGQPGTWC